MKVLSALVHLSTALGAVCALYATQAIFDGNATRVFIWLAIALFIDGIDGTFARATRVKDNLPRFSGEHLDLVVDYVTYVFVPVLALIAWHHLDGVLGGCLAAGILLSALFHFSDLESKSKDKCFVGFPAVWNIVAFYIFAIGPPQWVTLTAIVMAIAATFVPMPWVHPLRVVALRPLTSAVSALAIVAAVATLVHGFPAPALWQGVLIAGAVYYVGLSLYWWRQTSRG